MSSILTNNGAMVALQTLKGVNASMSKTQNEISTGKSVATAKDNAAIWAISKTMESDVAGFKAISSSLALGESTVAVARNAAESVTDLLTQIKDKVIAANKNDISAEERNKIQTDIKAMTEQIGTVTGSAQFNGQNLINGSSSNPVRVLSSLDRSTSGVAASYIDVDTFDMRSIKKSSADVSVTAATATTLTSVQFADATGAAATGGAALSKEAAGGGEPAGLIAGDSVIVQMEGHDLSYTIKEGDQIAEVVAGLNAAAAKDKLTGITFSDSTDDLQVTVAGRDAEVKVATVRGDMGQLAVMDVMSEEGSSAALEAIEHLIQKSIDNAAAFGSAERRVGTQKDFIGKLTDSLKSGIGSMVDADMEETSARLQALQVQQQLATQSLSIANQAPQALLSLFR
ncbi:flagellin N-terminal helical domain-containing protein [Paracoccus jiaweipingae]|uniref:flagellin N-terminal helical domain-containing protein n=1 Tax=unclassified Paracoccus (in: a-proteobacteria) TaxID=2688777 RepID=UPI0037A57D76